MLKKFLMATLFMVSTMVPQIALSGYLHNPLENPVVLRDVVPAPGNVFGFAPAKKDKDHPNATLGNFASGDFASFESVGRLRQIRIAYHEFVAERLDALMEQDISMEEKARAAIKIRNDARLSTYLDEDGKVKKGMEKGYKAALRRAEKNTYEFFHNEKGLSDEAIIQSAYGSNAGMDAVLGLYDRHFNAYKIMVPPNVIDSMSEDEKNAYDRLYAHFVRSSGRQRDKRSYLYFMSPEISKKMIVHLVRFNNY